MFDGGLENELRRLYVSLGQAAHEQNQDGDYPPSKSGFDLAALQDQFTGKRTLALNLVAPDDRTRVLVIDFDRATNAHWSALKKARAWLAGHGIQSAVSCSGRKGYGLWVSLIEPMHAQDAQDFLRRLSASVVRLPSNEVDLRPDVPGATKSARAVIKLPPCLHRGSGQWSGFIDPDLEDTPPLPYLQERPDTASQAALLAKVSPAPPEALKRAVEALKMAPAGVLKQQDLAGPKRLPALDNLRPGEHPPCIAALAEKGVPAEMQLNTANLNLAAYAASRGLSPEDGFDLARAVAEASDGHPSEKRTVEAKVRNFRSNTTPPAFHCDFAQNTPAWRALFNPVGVGNLDACKGCPAYVGGPAKTKESVSGNDTPRPISLPKHGAEPRLLETPVAFDLMAWAWRNHRPLATVRRVLPLFEGVALFDVAAEALGEGRATPAGFYTALDRLGADVRAETAETFLARLTETPVTDTQGEAAMERAETLAKRAALSDAITEADTLPLDVPVGAVALQLAKAADAALATDTSDGPLASISDEIFAGFRQAPEASTIATPWPRLTSLLHGGWHGGRLYVLLAPPKAGKTTLAAQSLDYAAEHGHPALYVGYEMARPQMVEYALSRRLSFDSRRIETRSLSPGDATKLAAGLESYLDREGRFLEVWEAGLATSVADIAGWCAKMKSQHPGKTPLVVVDYLQLARTGIREIDTHASETKRVSSVAVACKDLARSTGAAVLALSSVTKEADTAARLEGAIDATAARDSLAIVHAADGILSLQTRPVIAKGAEDGAPPIDPWQFIANQAGAEGDAHRKAAIARGIDRIADQYPPSGEGFGIRARITLDRHRGSTGDCPVYYRQAWHRMDAVDVPGMPPLDDGDGTDSEAFAAAFETVPHTVKHSYGNATFRKIRDLADAQAAVSPLTESLAAGPVAPLGLDIETTGLFPHEGAEIRLIQLAPHEGPALIFDLATIADREAVLDCLRAAFRVLPLVAHNAVFEMRFLNAAGFNFAGNTPHCTMLAEHALSGTMQSLKNAAAARLGVTLDKTAQTSDWSGDLTEDQLEYAAQDAIVARDLAAALWPKLDEIGARRVYDLMRAAQPAVADMEAAGMAFDAGEARALIATLEAEHSEHREALEAAMPGLNPNSPTQLAGYLTDALGGPDTAAFKTWPKTPSGNLATGARELQKGLALLAPAAQAVIADHLLPFKVVEKRISAFGAGLEKHMSAATGRIHASFKLAGTRTGRFSCSGPNLQQIPRDAVFRRLFRAPEGRRLIVADYSQMELRVAAIVANETRLLDAYANGRDTHALTAAMLLSKQPGDVSKEERQLAKAVNFGLLYGQSAKGLAEYAAASYGVSMSLDEARHYRDAWFASYPGFARWQSETAEKARASQSVATPSGRVRVFSPGTDDLRPTRAFNTPIQGGAAEVMLAALARVYDALAQAPELSGTVPVAVVHDEVIVETDAEHAERVSALVEKAMTGAMLDVFPTASTAGLVEVGAGQTWAEK